MIPTIKNSVLAAACILSVVACVKQDEPSDEIESSPLPSDQSSIRIAIGNHAIPRRPPAFVPASPTADSDGNYPPSAGCSGDPTRVQQGSVAGVATCVPAVTKLYGGTTNRSSDAVGSWFGYEPVYSSATDNVAFSNQGAGDNTLYGSVPVDAAGVAITGTDACTTADHFEFHAETAANDRCDRTGHAASFNVFFGPGTDIGDAFGQRGSAQCLGCKTITDTGLDTPTALHPKIYTVSWSTSTPSGFTSPPSGYAPVRAGPGTPGATIWASQSKDIPAFSVGGRWVYVAVQMPFHWGKKFVGNSGQGDMTDLWAVYVGSGVKDPEFATVWVQITDFRGTWSAAERTRGKPFHAYDANCTTHYGASWPFGSYNCSAAGAPPTATGLLVPIASHTSGALNNRAAVAWGEHVGENRSATDKPLKVNQLAVAAVTFSAAVVPSATIGGVPLLYSYRRNLTPTAEFPTGLVNGSPLWSSAALLAGHPLPSNYEPWSFSWDDRRLHFASSAWFTQGVENKSKAAYGAIHGYLNTLDDTYLQVMDAAQWTGWSTPATSALDNMTAYDPAIYDFTQQANVGPIACTPSLYPAGCPNYQGWDHAHESSVRFHLRNGQEAFAFGTSAFLDRQAPDASGAPTPANDRRANNNGTNPVPMDLAYRLIGPTVTPDDQRARPLSFFKHFQDIVVSPWFPDNHSLVGQAWVMGFDTNTDSVVMSGGAGIYKVAIPYTTPAQP